MTVAANKEIALRYMRLVERGQIDAALDLAADDARFWHPASGESSKEGVRAAFRQFAPMMRTFQTTVYSVTAEEDRVVVQLGAEMDLANGRHYSNQYLFLLVIREGRIRSVHEYVDTKPFEAAFAPV